jgi:hypothetical protein
MKLLLVFIVALSLATQVRFARALDTCAVLTDTAITGNVDIIGDLDVDGNITLAGDVTSDQCTSSVCTIKTTVDSLSSITSNGTFCSAESCDTINSRANAATWPIFFHAKIDVTAGNLYTTFASNASVLFQTEVIDRNSTYTPGNGSFVAPVFGFYQYGFAVHIDQMNIAAGGTNTVDFSCGLFKGSTLLDIMVKFKEYTNTGGLTVTSTGIISLNAWDAAQVKCNIVAHSGAITNIHVGSGNYHMLYISEL